MRKRERNGQLSFAPFSFSLSLRRARDDDSIRAKDLHKYPRSRAAAKLTLASSIPLGSRLAPVRYDISNDPNWLQYRPLKVLLSELNNTFSIIVIFLIVILHGERGFTKLSVVFLKLASTIIVVNFKKCYVHFYKKLLYF